MRIAIAGAGMTGSYLYRLLRNAGYTPELFDVRPRTHCLIPPCAWGTSRGFDRMVAAAGLDPARYLLRRSEVIVMDGIEIPGDLFTFHKPNLVKDLLQGAHVRRESIDPSRYDRIIDATGVARAFLPPIETDLVLPCVQWRVQPDGQLKNEVKLGKIGYAWCFPLSENEYHVGCGSLTSDPERIIAGLGWVRGKLQCGCKGSIRITGPRRSQPFFHRIGGFPVWGVGEAIGCVAPLAGDGVLPGMISAGKLLDHWDDPEGYRRAVLREFKWMESEREVIDLLRNKNSIGLKEAWVLKKNSRRMGLQVGVREAMALLKNLV